MAATARQCAICTSRFTPANAQARYCGEACRQRATRNRRNSSKAATAPKSGELVAAVRAELDAAGKATSVAGQLALTLARQIEASSSSATGAARELERQMDRALGRTGQPPPQEPEQPTAAPVEDDEVTRARRERDAKLGAATG